MLGCNDTKHSTTGLLEYVTVAQEWFISLRDKICKELENIEKEFSSENHQFVRKTWSREGGGGGEMSTLHGKVFEKAGVNISTVFGELDKEFAKNIKGTEASNQFYATGLSLVIHPTSPLVPAIHMNTRFIKTSCSWFGGGIDLNPMSEAAKSETKFFHNYLKKMCNNHDANYYDKFSKYCDDYFYIKHRKKHRGVGGIFYDHLDTGDFDKDFAFNQDVGKSFLETYPKIVKKTIHNQWSAEQLEEQLINRGHYTEFNLMYDRGTKFGFQTGGNPEAILMSLPPLAKWK